MNCPGCDGTLPEDRPLLCMECWELLPATKRRALTVAYRRRASRPAERDCQLESAALLCRQARAAESARAEDAPTPDHGNSTIRGELA